MVLEPEVWFLCTIESQNGMEELTAEMDEWRISIFDRAETSQYGW